MDAQQWPEVARPAVNREWSHRVKPALATAAGEGGDSVTNTSLPAAERVMSHRQISR